MKYEEYDYNYHDLAKQADYIEEDIYYNDGIDEPWMLSNNHSENESDSTGWDNYYHNLADEIADD